MSRMIQILLVKNVKGSYFFDEFFSFAFQRFENLLSKNQLNKK